MYLHSKLAYSEVNGPGRRAVIWFQGCTLACPGCWNPETHPFETGNATTPDQLAQWVLSRSNIEGVTFSGGEPFQQATDLLRVCELIKDQSPDLSIGVFTGYTLQELEGGRFRYRKPEDTHWIDGTRFLFHQIRAHMDFGVFGRFSKQLVSLDKPLCGSSNQQVLFFTDRYTDRDLLTQAFEIHIAEDGTEATFTGFPPSALVTEIK
jgi:anaerobic ribonucleoside-triphosphate reductase activating protein